MSGDLDLWLIWPARVDLRSRQGLMGQYGAKGGPLKLLVLCPAYTTRRDFLRTSATVATTAALGTLALERSVHAAGSDVIRVGLIGCGGRGTDAALNALNAGNDMPGLKISMAACEIARQKGLSILSGLCWRHDPGVRETMQRVQDGAIGEIVTIHENYLSSPYVVRPRRPGQTEIEYQMWNWYHFNWLSGDQTAQQLIHSLDKASWALGDRAPRFVYGVGGRQTMLAPEYGDLFDHQAFVLEYESGIRVFTFTRNQSECYPDTSDTLYGTKGRCDLLRYRIEGQTNWRYDRPRQNMYDLTHVALFDAIRAGRPINDGPWMCLSSALAIACQMAAYSGQLVTWDDVMSSQRSFALPCYGWEVEPPVQPGPDGRYPAAMQGNAEYEQWLI